MEFMMGYTTGGSQHGVNLNMEDMRRKADRLFAREADVAEQIKNELQPGRKLKKEVECWLGEVGKMKDKNQGIENDIEDTVKGRAFSRLIHDLKEEVKKFTDKCTDLLQPNNLPNELTNPADGNLPLATAPMKGGLFKENLEQVLSWLDGDGATSIGVYGMGGVGKTTLAKHVQNKLCQRFNNGKCSGYVYWVTVSHGVTLSSLQSKIAKQMGLENQLSGQDEEVSSAIIKEALKRRGNCVLILDDMWETFPAEEIGIPIGEHGFKLLVTARSKDVCNQMDCEKGINVKCLSDDEPWDLFKEKLGKSTILSEEVEDKARQVAEECKGLPIAIITIASSMRRVKSIEEWRNVLMELQQLTRQQEVVEEKILPSLQFSYDRLGNSQLQDCFLCCAFYPEDHSIWVEDELIACWTREGLLEGIESREERRDKGHSIVNRLVNACLLEYDDYYGKSYVKMHDLVREMAVKVCRGKHILIRAGEEMEDIPPEEEWTVDLCKVSLMSNDIKSISPVEPPNCPSLKTLLLGWNRGLKSISTNFFSHLTSLRVLDLSGTRIKSLPEGISGLVNLTALLLGSCESLTHLPSLSKLQKLRELDLHESGIKSLPESISDLVNLTELLLGYCESLTDLPSLSKLHKLRKLDLSWTWIKSLPESISDLLNLTDLLLKNCWRLTALPSLSKLQKLTKLDLSHTGIKSLPESISGLVNLTDLLLEGCQSLTDLPSLSKLHRLTKLDLSFTGIKSLPESISDLVNLTELLLGYCQSLTDLPSLSKLHKLTELDLRELRNLKSIRSGLTLRYLRMSNCEALEEVIAGSDNDVVDQPRYLPKLENLWLVYLPNLKSIRSGGLSNLREIEVKNCDGLRWLFTPTMACNLQNLSRLRIECCVALEEVIGGSDNVVDQPRYLPKLENLELVLLPNLKSIRSGGLSDLRELKVNCCDGLKWLFTPTMACNLQNLSELGIHNCEALEEVIGGSDNDVVDQPRYLPKLENLWLSNLPNLKWLFTPTMACNMQNLSSLLISHCKALEEVIGGSNNDVVDQPRYLPKLENLWLEGLPNLKSIRSGGLSNLRELEVNICHGLKWLFTPTMAGNLQNLSLLWISNCKALEEVIGGSDNDVVDQPTYLPKLENLELNHLPNLKRICPVGNVGCDSIERDVWACPKLEW